MQAFGYCRVSSVMQATDGVSMDAQRAKIAAWCAANDATLVETFADAGMSGGRADNRPGLQDALSAVCRAKGGVLVVYSLSRMARSTRDTLVIAERLQRAGANLVSLSEKIDTTSAAGKMVFRLLAVLNEFERDLASERTKLAAAWKRSKGEAWSVAPFGQAKSEDGKLIDDASEQEAIAQIQALRDAGLSVRAIVKEMNDRGIPGRDGGRWHVATVQRTLKRLATQTV